MPNSLPNLRFDSDDNLGLFKLILENEGVAVHCASNGAEAVNLARVQEFDVVLMDIQMPVMDGYEAFQKMRSNGFQGAVLALTAHAMREEVEQVASAGFSGYLSKPIHRQRLIEKIAEVIS